ncbi:MAG: winged helix-turn-helix transcriptional regulator [Chloroflexi bacterium]|nr:winged helix-turn-helix transcriptional regulator [Chloroflexota bacterium]
MEISQRHADMCAALGDISRLLLLYAMADEPRNVSELVARVGLSQPTVSRHLRILRDSGLVNAERRGKLIYYYPTDRRIVEAMDVLRLVLTEQMQQQGNAARSATIRPPV